MSTQDEPPATDSQGADPEAKAGVAVGARIKKRRRFLKMSAQSLGDIVGVSAMQIGNYEKGLTRMAAVRLYAISLALDVPISYFFADLDSGSGDGTEVTESLARTGDSEVITILQLGQIAAQIEDPKVRSTVRDLLRGLPTYRNKRRKRI